MQRGVGWLSHFHPELIRKLSYLKVEDGIRYFYQSGQIFFDEEPAVKKALESIMTNQLPRYNPDFQLKLQWLVVNRIGVLLNSHLSGNSKFVFSSYQSRWEIRLTSAGIPHSWSCANIMSCSCMNMKTLTCASSARPTTTALVYLSSGILSGQWQSGLMKKTARLFKRAYTRVLLVSLTFWWTSTEIRFFGIILKLKRFRILCRNLKYFWKLQCPWFYLTFFSIFTFKKEENIKDEFTENFCFCQFLLKLRVFFLVLILSFVRFQNCW